MPIIHCAWISCVSNKNGNCAAIEVYLENGLLDYDETLICETFAFKEKLDD
jgi:hypothetical protein